jgi:hypothetical protein
MADNSAEDDLDTISVRAAYVGFQMALGWTPTTADVAQQFGISHAGAHMLMERVSRAIPILKDRRTRQWVTTKAALDREPCVAIRVL